MPSRVLTDAERRRREARVEQSMKIRSRSCIGRRVVGGSVSAYVRYLELSREPKHVAQQMGYQNVDCLGTIIIFLLKSRDLLCACAIDIWLYLQYYWPDLAQTCSLGSLAMFRILSLRLIHAMHALTSRQGIQ